MHTAKEGTTMGSPRREMAPVTDVSHQSVYVHPHVPPPAWSPQFVETTDRLPFFAVQMPSGYRLARSMTSSRVACRRVRGMATVRVAAAAAVPSQARRKAKAKKSMSLNHNESVMIELRGMYTTYLGRGRSLLRVLPIEQNGSSEARMFVVRPKNALPHSGAYHHRFVCTLRPLIISLCTPPAFSLRDVTADIPACQASTHGLTPLSPHHRIDRDSRRPTTAYRLLI
ncbi:hypothetical protein CALVIDRAFT_223028 [Calocera viscosa TUFC12733]|uniref:Uncharacterized protein n=1 Tax=Calocera viscosa (strain TUFC12733) TaxID=1330018 RepID=A0A167K6Y5_CALVF|nr:hypothetical protein CALVIDRAFT_223028 [Calocera viscosa TUFC12733]